MVEGAGSDFRVRFSGYGTGYTVLKQIPLKAAVAPPLTVIGEGGLLFLGSSVPFMPSCIDFKRQGQQPVAVRASMWTPLTLGHSCYSSV